MDIEKSVVNLKVKKMLKIITILSLIAMGITLWLTYIHYKPLASEFCNFNERWDCEIVNKSEWSVVNLGSLEIPVAIMGFGTYLILFIGAVGVIRKWNFQKIHSWLSAEKIIKLMSYLAYIGLFFSLYLTYIEAFKLLTFCLFCVIQQIIILIISGIFVMLSKNKVYQ